MRFFRFIYYFSFFLAVAASTTSYFPHRAVAAGFGVSPSSLDFTVVEGSESSRQLTIYNTGADARFMASSDNPAITVVPSTAMLGKSESAAVTVTAAGKKAGKSSGEILISFIPEGGSAGNEVLFSLGTRVGVSLAVIENAVQSANFFVGMLASAGIVVAGLSLYLPIRSRVRHPLHAWLKRA